MDKEKIIILKNSLLEIIQKNKKILLLISGGADSVFLFHFLIEYFSKIEIHLLHVNYQLRGEESQKDENFIKDLIQKYQKKKNILGHFYKVLISKKKNFQKEAREIRYQIANEILEKNNISILFTAHHQNDLIETFFFKMLKGKNLLFPGLYQKNKIYRPLLNISKNEILNYLQKNKICYRQDQSNFENKYQRNRIRNQIITKINEIFPASLQNIFRSIQYLFSYQKILKKIIFDGRYFFIENNTLFFTKNFFTFFNLEEQISLFQFYFNCHHPSMRISHLQFNRIVKDLSKAFQNQKAIFLTIEKKKFYFQFPFFMIEKKKEIDFFFIKKKDYYIFESKYFNLILSLKEAINLERNKKNIYFQFPQKYKDINTEEIKIKFLDKKDKVFIRGKEKNINTFFKKKGLPCFFREQSYVLQYRGKILFWFSENKKALESLSLPYCLCFI